ncbi:MAG: hypothetical protein EBU84_04545 [Actinobacteria bacterium]|jgi:hypothetical protein|nr:hypothetical protein [Actinomycetota bacterium]
MNSFEYGFYDELQKLATVEDGTLSLPKKVRYDFNPLARNKASAQAIDRMNVRGAEAANHPVASRVLGPLTGGMFVADILGSSNPYLIGAGAGVGVAAKRPIAEAMGAGRGLIEHNIDRLRRIRRANQYLAGRQAGRELR